MTDPLREYTRKVRVAGYEVGAQSVLKFSVLMRMCQETSEKNMEALGLGYEKMRDDGIVFVLITSVANLRRMPLHNEEITIRTHPLGMHGAQFYRDFLFFCGEESVADVTQTSVVVDARTHRLLRPAQFLQYGVFSAEKIPSEKRIPRLSVPEDLPFAGDRPVRYSDLDFNRHLNNTVYGDILLDFLPGGAERFRISQVWINFLTESRTGDTLKIYAGERDGAVLMRGDNARGCGFAARITGRRKKAGKQDEKS